MKKYLIILSFLCSLLGKSQVVLKALEAPDVVAGTFTSTKTSSANANFTRNNCAVNYYGTTVNYAQSATATATSSISQADADTKATNQAYANALAAVNAGGQSYANTNGSCIYSPPGQSSWTSTKCSLRQGPAYRNNCGAGYVGGSVIYSTGNICRTYTSYTSQADADSQAQAQADAASLADWNANAVNYANANASCIQTSFTSTKCSANTGPVYRNNCPSGYTGGSVTYSTGSICRTYTSNISQADADNNAQAQAIAASEAVWNANAQNYANANAACTQEQWYAVFTKLGEERSGDCGVGGCQSGCGSFQNSFMQLRPSYHAPQEVFFTCGKRDNGLDDRYRYHYSVTWTNVNPNLPINNIIPAPY